MLKHSVLVNTRQEAELIRSLATRGLQIQDILLAGMVAMGVPVEEVRPEFCYWVPFSGRSMNEQSDTLIVDGDSTKVNLPGAMDFARKLIGERTIIDPHKLDFKIVGEDFVVETTDFGLAMYLAERLNPVLVVDEYYSNRWEGCNTIVMKLRNGSDGPCLEKFFPK